MARVFVQLSIYAVISAQISSVVEQTVENLSLSLSCGPLFVVARRRCRHRRGEEEVRGSDRGRVGQRLETAIKEKLQGKPSEKPAETVFNAANNASFLRKITLIVTGRPLHAAITGLSRIRKRMQFLLLLLHLLLLRAACTPEIKRCLSSQPPTYKGPLCYVTYIVLSRHELVNRTNFQETPPPRIINASLAWFIAVTIIYRTTCFSPLTDYFFPSNSNENQWTWREFVVAGGLFASKLTRKMEMRKQTTFQSNRSDISFPSIGF